MCSIRQKRTPVDTPVRIQTSDKALNGNTKDISVSGVYLTIPENLQEGIHVKLEIYFQGQERPVEAEGRIAWSNTGDNRPKPFYPEGYGVEITDFENSDEDLFAEYLEKNLNSSTKYH